MLYVALDFTENYFPLSPYGPLSSLSLSVLMCFVQLQSPGVLLVPIYGVNYDGPSLVVGTRCVFSYVLSTFLLLSSLALLGMNGQENVGKTCYLLPDIVHLF